MEKNLGNLGNKNEVEERDEATDLSLVKEKEAIILRQSLPSESKDKHKF